MQFTLPLLITLLLLISTSFCACKTKSNQSYASSRSLIIDLPVFTASAASFCKCTCKGNSTIIPLNPETSPSSSSTSPNLAFRELSTKADAEDVKVREEEPPKTHRANTCNDCNRKFCLDYNLPACKGVKDEEVFTTCFRMLSVLYRSSCRDFLLITMECPLRPSSQEIGRIGSMLTRIPIIRA